MPNMRSLKVGDRVVYVGKHPGFSESHMKGKTGTVTQVYANDVFVRWDSYYELGHYLENVELIEEAPPAAPEGPFYVFAVPTSVTVFKTLEEAEDNARKQSTGNHKSTYGIFRGLKAYAVPCKPQEVPLAS